MCLKEKEIKQLFRRCDEVTRKKPTRLLNIKWVMKSPNFPPNNPTQKTPQPSSLEINEASAASQLLYFCTGGLLTQRFFFFFRWLTWPTFLKVFSHTSSIMDSGGLMSPPPTVSAHLLRPARWDTERRAVCWCACMRLCWLAQYCFFASFFLKKCLVKGKNAAKMRRLTCFAY